jgi:hypothetical protein
MHSLLALDPGLGGTGYALWIARKRAEHTRRHWAPDQAGVIDLRGDYAKEEWWVRCHTIAELIKLLLPSERTNIVCEFTEYHQAAHRVMSWKTGDLQKLTFLSGVIYAVTRPNPFLPIVTSGWKGQLSKRLVEERIRTRLGRQTCERLGIKTHAWDATGIGLWALGRF